MLKRETQSHDLYFYYTLYFCLLQMPLYLYVYRKWFDKLVVNI